jgi:hypothetical protein
MNLGANAPPSRLSRTPGRALRRSQSRGPRPCACRYLRADQSRLRHHLEPRFSVYAWNMPGIYHVYVDVLHTIPCICRCPTYTWYIHHDGISLDIPCISIMIRLDIHGISLYILGHTMYIHQVYTWYIHGYAWYIIGCIYMVYTWYIMVYLAF